MIPSPPADEVAEVRRAPATHPIPVCTIGQSMPRRAQARVRSLGSLSGMAHIMQPVAEVVIDGVEGVREAVGRHLGYSDWMTITQERIDLFADATGDHQWIHVDPQRAAAGPFGATIAHGYLTLSLVSHFLPQVVEVKGISMGINYGTNKVRFPAPVRVGSRVRGGVEMVAVEDVTGGVQATSRVTVEIEGGDKPACVADIISRYLA